MKLFLKKVAGLTLPSQATKDDAGYDVVATSEPLIVGDSQQFLDKGLLYRNIQYIQYETNLYIAPKDENVVYDPATIGTEKPVILSKDTFHTEFWPRSSISKYYLILANSIGLVDNGYRNQVFLRFKYTWQPEDLIHINENGGLRSYGLVRKDKIYQKGDKIAQIQASLNVPIEFELVDDLTQTERGTGGFGSTGK